MDNGDEVKDRTVLAIYCRHPETKRVKTRLARGVGSTEARLFYSGCLESLRHDLSILRRRFDIAICPSDAKDVDWAKSYFLEHDHIIPQIFGNLGLRIEHTDLKLRCQGYEKVILIGSDAPSLPIRFIEDVDNFLSRVDVVLGPCSDGGVYAIGSRITLLPMSDIPWGTEAVFSGLLEKYKHEDIDVGIPSSWYDVDRVEDLAIAREDLMRSSHKHRNVLGGLIGEILSSATQYGVGQIRSSRMKTKMSSYNKNGGEE